MKTAVKICGIRTPEAIQAAARGGATCIGLVFHPRSPRYVSPDQARALLQQVPDGLQPVALVADPDDNLVRALAALERLTLLQLHGGETPQRVAAIRSLWPRSVMKALPVAVPEDLSAVTSYAPLVDKFLFDAKPPPGGPPGGNALAFDWRILSGQTFSRPWFLAGGLTPDNVAEAIRVSGATAVDVSSGVEDSPGVKSMAKIAAFCAAAQSA